MTRQLHHGTAVQTRAAFAALTCGFIALLGTRVYGDALGNPTGSGSVPALQYQLVELGTLGGPSSRAIAMSDRGSIVGWSEVASATTAISPPPIHAFLWTDGLMQDLGTLGGNWSEARGVNSARQVVGSSLNALGEQRAFYYYDESIHDLNDLVEIAQAHGKSFVAAPQLFAAGGINNAGQIVACGTVSTDESIHGYLLTPIDRSDLGAPRFRMQDLGPVPAVAVSAFGDRRDVGSDSDTQFGSANSDLADIGGKVPGDPVLDLLSAWGSERSEWDLDGNGVVGMSDLLILLGDMAGSAVQEVSATSRTQSGLPDTSDRASDGRGTSVLRVPGTGEFSIDGNPGRPRERFDGLDSPPQEVSATNRTHSGAPDTSDRASDGRGTSVLRVPGTGEFSIDGNPGRPRERFDGLDSPPQEVSATNRTHSGAPDTSDRATDGRGTSVLRVPGTGEFSIDGNPGRPRERFDGLDSPPQEVSATNRSHSGAPDTSDRATDGRGTSVLRVPGTGEFSIDGNPGRTRERFDGLDTPPQEVSAAGGPPVGSDDPTPGTPVLDCLVSDINDSGMVVGTIGEQAYMWLDGMPALIEISAAITTSSANAVNEIGEVAGWTMTPAGPAAVLWIEGKSAQLHAFEGWISEALDVNDFGQAVGWASASKDGSDAAAFLWTNGQALDLNLVTAVKLTSSYLQIEEAVAIDEHERIAGSFRTTDGRTVASLLIPLD